MENQNEKDYMEIDLAEVFYIIKDNLRNIFVVTLCCVLIAAAYVFMRPKAVATYTSEALVRVRQMPGVIQTTRVTASKKTTTGEGGIFAAGPFNSSDKSESVDNYVSNLGYGPLNLNQRLLTYGEILSSRTFLTPVNEAIGATGVVKTTPVKDTEMMKISFTANEAEKAQQGNALLIKRLQEYVAKKDHSETRYVVSEGTGDPKAGEAPAVEAVVTEHITVDIIDPPTLPAATTVAKNTKRTFAVSALLGILLGSGYAVLHALMNRKITTRQDIEDYLGLPVLAVVPEENSLAEAMARQNGENVLQKIGGFLWKEQN